MIFLNSDIKSHNVHFTFAMTRSWFCSKGSRRTKKTPLRPGAVCSFLLLCTSRQEPHSKEHTGWTAPVLFGISWTDGSGLARPWWALVQSHPVGVPQGDLCTVRASLGCTGSSSHCPFITLKPSFGCIMLWASEEAPSVGFCERPGRSPLSAATGGENTWRCLWLCLGKCSPAQRGEQCGNSEPSSRPQYPLRFLKSSGCYSPDDGVAQETDSHGAFI